LVFLLASLAEIGGGWLVWKWWRDDRPISWGVGGAALLIAYGLIATYQTAPFGRTYATYGGIFIALSMLWGWQVDGDRPDAPDLIGASVALVGVGVMMYWPRSS
jgi:small multidrug resistance family-3 protein